MDEQDAVEDRLEAALERIAKVVVEPDPVAAEVADRLDHIIATLRGALGALPQRRVEDAVPGDAQGK